MLPDRGGDDEAALLRVRRSSDFFLASMSIFNPFPNEENAMDWSCVGGTRTGTQGSRDPWERIMAGMKNENADVKDCHIIEKRFCACKPSYVQLLKRKCESLKKVRIMRCINLTGIYRKFP
jgi:hypothetical protein